MLGLEELIAPSLAAYESTALKFAKDPDLLSDMRKKLARHCGTMPLFDTARFTRGLEQGYIAMWTRAQQNLPATSFSVEEHP